MQPLVSIVVPVYNGSFTISECIESLINQDYPKDRVEILIVDNNSNDRTKEIIMRYSVKYLFERKRGPAAARNKGIRQSKGDFIAFTDSDCVAKRDWLNNLMEGFSKDYIACCAGGTFAYPSNKTWTEGILYTLYNKVGNLSKNNFTTEYRVLPYAPGCNAAFRREFLEKMNLFDESFFWYEDLDLSWRLILTGHQLRYIPKAIVYHRCRDSFIKFYMQIFRSRYGMNCRFKKYPWIDKKSESINHFKNGFLVFVALIKFIQNFAKNSTTKQDKIWRWFHFVNLVKKYAIFCGDIYWGLTLRGKKFSPFLPCDGKVYWWKVDRDIAISRYEKGNFERYLLKGVGAKIWELLNEGKTNDNIIDIIENEFEADREEIHKYFLMFLMACSCFQFYSYS